MEQDKKKQDEITYTTPVDMNVTNAIVSYQPPEKEENKNKKAK